MFNFGYSFLQIPHFHVYLGVEDLVHEAELVLNHAEGADGVVLEKISAARFSVLGAHHEADNEAFEALEPRVRHLKELEVAHGRRGSHLNGR